MEYSITEQLDPDELAAGWKEIDSQRPKRHAVVTIGAKSDMGCVRENNEDKYDLLEPRMPSTLAVKGRMYGVADGMGGHAAGQIASEVALKTLIHSYFESSEETVDGSLREAVQYANQAVFDGAQVLPERQGMGTTLTAVVLREDNLHVVHIGDSRAYLIRDSKIRQITEDHSWVGEQVRLGGMTLDEAMASPYRNIILRSIGTGMTVEADYYSEFLNPGDSIVLCSDGLTGHVEDDEIAAIAGGESLRKIGPSYAASELIALANSRGGRDNITVVIIFVEAIIPYQASPGL